MQDVGIGPVNALHAEQGKVPLILFRRPNLAGDGRPLSQSETSNLTGRDVDIIGARQVVIIRTAEEAEPVGQDLQRPLTEHQPGHLGPLFEDAEDEVLFLQARNLADLFLLGEVDQLFHRHALQSSHVDVVHHIVINSQRRIVVNLRQLLFLFILVTGLSGDRRALSRREEIATSLVRIVTRRRGLQRPPLDRWIVAIVLGKVRSLTAR